MMRARFLAAGLAAAILSAPAAADRPTAADPAPETPSASAEDPFAWLEGEWVRETRRGSSAETWVRVSESTMEGTVTAFAGGESRVTEHLRLERFGEEVFYVAKPAENAFPTAFKLVETGETEDGDTRFVFENPHHDFPQRIIYRREGDDGLLARIEGTMEGEERGIDFRFRRKL